MRATLMPVKTFWFIFLLVCVSVSTASVSMEAVAESTAGSGKDLAQKQFEIWRAEIPDYERRLYNRVKKNNTRNLVILRAVIISAILILILVPAFTLWVVRSQMGSINLSVVGKGDDGDIESKNEKNVRYVDLNALMKRQKKLIKMHDQLLALTDEISQGRQDIERLVRKLTSETETFNRDLETALSENQNSENKD